MADEQKKEICKAYFYGDSPEHIAETEKLPTEDVQNAVLWGNQTDYFEELKERGR